MKAKIIFVNSVFTQSNVRKTYGRVSVVVYPGIDFKLYQPVKASMKKNYLITAARITKYKRLDILVRAMVLLEDRGILLHIVGDGEGKAELQKLSDKLNLAERVIFSPALPAKDLAKLISEAKLFVSCSHNETFGLVLLESLAVGTPVVSQNSGGPKEIIRDGENGLLIDCNPVNLAKKIDYLLRNEDKLDAMANLSRDSIQKKFSWETSAQKIMAYLS